MTDLTLYIANKNYSSWSFRPWIALTAAGIDFKEVLIRFDFPAGNPGIKAISPTGQVPVLVHGDVKIWESLAIIEYAAELFLMAVSGHRRSRTGLLLEQFRSKCWLASGPCAMPAR